MVLLYFLSASTIQTPQHNKREESYNLYAILKGYKFNVGRTVEKSIWSYFRIRFRGLVPYLATITRLYILGGVEGAEKEEETCLKSSPLTLTRITKGPKNRGKEKEVEIEEEEEEEEGDEKEEHVQLESPAQK